MPNFLRVIAYAACFLAAVTTALEATAQTITEEFDGGFTASLGWSGDLDAFAEEEGRLVLREGRAEPSSSARASFPAEVRDSACWTLDVDQAFSASASNRLRYWLAADRPLFGNEPVGYYLQFGGVSGSEDALELFYESDTSHTLVAAGTPGLAAANPLSLNVRVCADFGQRWTVAARDTVGALVDTASGVGPETLAGRHVGFDVRFTASRSGLLSADDLSVGPVVIDVEAPFLVLAQAPSSDLVEVVASESLIDASLAVNNYRVGGRPVSSVSTAGDTVRLTLTAPLADGRPTAVTIASWRDLAGNASGPLEATVVYTAPRQLARYELLITEIMADPTPSIGLPEAEYVEVYNAGVTAIDLSTVTVATERDEARLPAVTLAPGAYVALAERDTGDDRFATFPELPTLPNGGASLRLLVGGQVIDEVAYAPGLYPTGLRDGGYSLERVDLSVPCALAADNLRASTSISGGTPGAANAAAARIDVPPLQLLRVAPQGTDTVIASVNRVLSEASAGSFLVGGRAPVVIGASREAGRYSLVLDAPLSPGQVVEVGLVSEARSCASGELVSERTLPVGIAERSNPGDWALNEIMYDPLAGQGRYVELVNVSDRLLSLDQLRLSRADADGQPEETFDIDGGTLVAPGGYLVVAADPVSLRQQYPDVDAAAVVEAVVPTLNDEACLSLVDAVAGERYFLICYAEDWHHGAYAKTDGVSLERIDLAADADDANNWTSAASTAGFGTPTLTNSQARTERTASDATLALQSERLSPDGDGFEDQLLVDYAFDAPGTLVTFEVVDLNGRSLYRPGEQEAVAREGTWAWDGVTDEGAVATVGTYVLRVEWWREGAVAEREYLAFSVLGQR